MPYLDTYSGNWTANQARHLLRRTTFGPSPEMIAESLGIGMESSLDMLFRELPLPSPPVKYIPDGSGSNQLDDPGARYGDPWIDAAPFPNVNPPMYRNRILRSRSKSLYAWTYLQMHDSGISLRDKMTLFWHNHFVVANSVIPHREYWYQNLLRSQALGNFRQLTKDITVDTGMLLYLSGAENTSQAPNENYSRELLELFTVGKGPLAGPGDYTNYTEEDVRVMARILTGWRVRPLSDPNAMTATFSNARHTTGDKVLSHRFGNATITENGETEYLDLIDRIFQQRATAQFITRKLYRWFVGSKITPDVEQQIINPLADTIAENDYEIAPALRILFASDHFYEATSCMIKSPVDLLFSVTRGLGIAPPDDEINDTYEHAYTIYAMCSELEQALYQHPNVAGWKAYYQAPGYDRTWINNLLLPKRFEYCRLMVEGGNTSIDDEPYRVTSLVPILQIVETVPEAEYPDVVISALADMLFTAPISQGQIKSLKEVLIPGLPDYEWTAEYEGYRNNPDDPTLRQSVENRLRSLLSVMVRMSEFQVM